MLSTIDIREITRHMSPAARDAVEILLSRGLDVSKLSVGEIVSLTSCSFAVAHEIVSWVGN